jgi:hypothetical protein
MSGIYEHKREEISIEGKKLHNYIICCSNLCQMQELLVR